MAEFKTNDIVEFAQDYAGNVKAGDLAVVRRQAGSYVYYTARNGQEGSCFPERLKAAQGTWVPVTPGNIHKLVPGETLVRPVETLYGDKETFTALGIHVVKSRGLGTVTIPNKAGGESTFGLTYNSGHGSKARFESFVQDAGDPAKAMTYEQALKFLPQFIALGEHATVRGRSWDKKGLFAAIELVDANGKAREKLYRPQDCEARLEELDKAPAVDIVGVPDGMYYTFKTIAGNLLNSRGGSAWSVPDIRECKGIVRQGTTKYRLCKDIVTHTIVPIAD
jgi:hypothetical protein